ncbi:hypothetical protein NQ318_013221 [Aromia moschata]|uniref:Uncharacterized protein n=1 Tax=Aromia moschata TaxID=1265417 RepID=A0AAV8YCK5_9CUCU|nr:hypothetical protein NQ318_013221 [Aromia moschata]
MFGTPGRNVKYNWQFQHLSTSGEHIAICTHMHISRRILGLCAGKALIQTCLNSPDPPAGSAGGDQRMSATGFEETELTYNISDEDSKVRQMVYGSPHTHAHPHSLAGQGHYSHLEQGHLGLGGRRSTAATRKRALARCRPRTKATATPSIRTLICTPTLSGRLS